MAATDPHPRADARPGGGRPYLRAGELDERLQEEVHRAQRHGTPLSCLLLTIDDPHEVAREDGGDLLEQTLDYVAAALARELRDFDRVGRTEGRELAILLPGADGPRGELVARRMLERLRTIKVEEQGERRPLRVSLGLASWAERSSGEQLLGRARAAARGIVGGEEPAPPSAPAEPFAQWNARRSEAQASELRRHRGGRIVS